MEVNKLYRCFIGLDFDDETDAFKSIIDFDEFEVIKRTKCGFWIIYKGKKKFVLNYGNRRFAFPTKGEAEKNFVYRTNRHLEYLKNEINSVEQVIKHKLFIELMKKHNLVKINRV